MLLVIEPTRYQTCRLGLGWFSSTRLRYQSMVLDSVILMMISKTFYRKSNAREVQLDMKVWSIQNAIVSISHDSSITRTLNWPDLVEYFDMYYKGLSFVKRFRFYSSLIFHKNILVLCKCSQAKKWKKKHFVKYVMNMDC